MGLRLIKVGDTSMRLLKEASMCSSCEGRLIDLLGILYICGATNGELAY